MRVVIDTNVVVSAVLKDRNPEAVISFVTETDGFEWIASPEILDEYIAVLRRRKFNLPEEIIDRWVEMFSDAITVLPVVTEINYPRDQKDAKFLACAIDGDAQFLISGDGDILDARKIAGTIMIPVSVFKRVVCDRWVK